MKKTIFAVAAVAAFSGAAHAQSSVTLYGVMDVSTNSGEDQIQLGATTTTVKQRTTGAGKDGLASSRIGIRGVEDLGGGLKANFVWEQGIVSVATGGTGVGQASTNTADASVSTAGSGAFTDPRAAWVGLSGGFGEMRIGRQTTSIHNVIGAYSAGGANNVAGALYSAGGSVANTSNVRNYEVYANRLVQYTSPVMSGFQLTIQTAQQAAVSETTSSAITSTSTNGTNLSYVSGKFSAGLAYQAAYLNGSTAASTTADIKQVNTAAGASYNFGVAQVFTEYLTFKATNSAGATLTKSAGYELGVKAPVTKTVDVWASVLGGSKTGGDGYTSTTTLNRSLTAIQGQGDVSGFQLGSKYNLSKRTSVYAIGGTQSIKGTGTSTGNKNTATQMALGINHVF